MSMLYVLISVALMLLGVALWALFWAIRSGQFDDLDSQGWSVVLLAAWMAFTLWAGSGGAVHHH